MLNLQKSTPKRINKLRTPTKKEVLSLSGSKIKRHSKAISKEQETPSPAKTALFSPGKETPLTQKLISEFYTKTPPSQQSRENVNEFLKAKVRLFSSIFN